MAEEKDLIPLEFKASLYSLEAEKFNEISHKGRARIFYRGRNRNGSYITEEFAKQLINTAPYTPVKAIWDEDINDFTDHGEARTQGKIYGVVLENPNFAWEDFEDKDGVTRTYACVDVIVYTAIYPEANKIIGKPLSMELLPSSIKGSWQTIDGESSFKFDSGAFAGLQALGDDVEPCFEGAQFFSLFKAFQTLYNNIKNYSLKTTGGQEMAKLNFKFSENENFELIWQSINPNYTEEDGWKISSMICSIGEDCALCYDYENEEFFQQYFTKNEDKVELSAKKKCYSLMVDEAVFQSLNALKELNDGSFEKIDEKFSALNVENASLKAQAEESAAAVATTIDELNVSINSLNEQLSSTTAELDVLKVTYQLANEEIEQLRTFKLNAELKEKEAILNKYASNLDGEILKNYSLNLTDYTADTLEKELSYELVKATPSLFSKQATADVLIPKDQPLTGIEAILEKYR